MGDVLARFVFFYIFCIAFSLQSPVNVTVYYECLCPDSSNFVINQLYPAYQRIKEAFYVDLVPYGKASQVKKNDTWEFTCQHGPSECYGNKVQGCILHTRKPFDDKIAFINCVENADDPSRAEVKCGRKFGFNTRKIRACAHGNVGSDYLAEYGDRTPRISFVPSIFFNGYFNQTLQASALQDLLTTVCDLVEENKPSACLESKIDVYKE